MHSSTTDRPFPSGPYLVAGLGRAGRAAIEALAATSGVEQVSAWDRCSDGAVRALARGLRRRGVEVRLGGDGLAALDAAGKGATIVKSPGIDMRRVLFQLARERDQQVLDELELGWSLSRDPIVGVTGTNGKSTTAKLIATVLGAAGHTAQLCGNTEFGPPLSAATPGGWRVCEVSSFQLEATRAFLPDVGVFTNLTLEHLARHTDMENYGAIKRSMFFRGDLPVEAAVVNIDDPFGHRLALDLDRAGARVVSYGFHADADVRVQDATWDMHMARQHLRTPDGAVECATRLPGRYNASNVAAAFAMGQLIGLSAPSVSQALEGAGGPPGRWERIAGPQEFDVVVDFAHNPDGIRQLLETARAVIAGRDGAALRAVFGPTGAFEAGKEREIGRLAGTLSDHLILTTGTLNYDARVVRLEELRAAASGGGAAVEIELDRRAAIERAIAAARPGDVVALLGLGALERLVMDTVGTSIPFDDRQVASEALNKIRSIT
ncbi:MAG TPA: Mur ligase family protein [Solirubrobacteraceae bacterium]|nr:Mur ligase family protein [Solirubrobacteraceae bacterium]